MQSHMQRMQEGPQASAEARREKRAARQPDAPAARSRRKPRGKSLK
jgi:hypothetical protein